MGGCLETLVRIIRWNYAQTHIRDDQSGSLPLPWPITCKLSRMQISGPYYDNPWISQSHLFPITDPESVKYLGPCNRHPRNKYVPQGVFVCSHSPSHWLCLLTSSSSAVLLTHESTPLEQSTTSNKLRINHHPSIYPRVPGFHLESIRWLAGNPYYPINIAFNWNWLWFYCLPTICFRRLNMERVHAQSSPCLLHSIRRSPTQPTQYVVPRRTIDSNVVARVSSIVPLGTAAARAMDSRDSFI